ncbi:RILP-like protein 1 [Tachysurus fulvidraco]|uniref:RILP-like protein 1 n=1 Tax=Tachysurus fulvidraco TaxID=1234273 RepID=UPI000F4E428B|nr:RILP-like protein 1 [Tachysurus fulvidraco]
METIMNNQDGTKLDECFERNFSALTVDDVYEIAKVVGSDVEKLIDSYGRTSVEALVRKIVKVLELLESFTVSYHTQKSKEENLLRAFETLQVQQQESDKLDWQQKEQKWRLELETLQKEVLQLKEENQELLGHLQSSLSKEDHSQRQEREVMLKLKEVVDKQRDELRAKVQEISKMSKEVEALQEQLDRFMKMNGELRNKQSVMHAQLKSTAERKVDLDIELSEKEKEIERLVTQLEKAKANTAPNPNSPPIDMTYKVIIDLLDPNRPCFTKQEIRDILFERNELKANLFLMQEELAFYQREILSDERCPGFLLEAVRGALKKQRTVIKAKMLGIPEDECSSDEEKGPLFEKKKDEDCPDSKPRESRIRNFFGYLSRSGSDRSGHQTNTSAWEIIHADEHVPEVENGPGGTS